MGITKSFERKFLLGWGRHLWNIVGVSGFIAVLTGGVLFINSAILKTPKKFCSLFTAGYSKRDVLKDNLTRRIIITPV